MHFPPHSYEKLSNPRAPNTRNETSASSTACGCFLPTPDARRHLLPTFSVCHLLVVYIVLIYIAWNTLFLGWFLNDLRLAFFATFTFAWVGWVVDAARRTKRMGAFIKPHRTRTSLSLHTHIYSRIYSIYAHIYINISIYTQQRTSERPRHAARTL